MTGVDIVMCQTWQATGSCCLGTAAQADGYAVCTDSLGVNLTALLQGLANPLQQQACTERQWAIIMM